MDASAVDLEEVRLDLDDSSTQFKRWPYARATTAGFLLVFFALMGMVVLTTSGVGGGSDGGDRALLGHECSREQDGCLVYSDFVCVGEGHLTKGCETAADGYHILENYVLQDPGGK